MRLLMNNKRHSYQETTKVLPVLYQELREDQIHSLTVCTTPLLKWGIEVSKYFRIVYFSLQICPFLLHVSWGSAVRITYKCFMDCPFYDYKMFFFVFNNNFCLKVYFVWYSHSGSLLVAIWMIYLFPPLYFQPICLFESRQHIVAFLSFSWRI